MSKYIVTVRQTSNEQFNNKMGSIRYLIVPDNEVPTPTHEVALKVWVKAILDENSSTSDVLFFVHGFNVELGAMDLEHRHVKGGLGQLINCTLVSFDWPSAGETYAYLPDLDTAKRTAILLVNAGIRPLLAAQTEKCKVAIHVLCHSMGAYVVREAFDHADDGIITGSDWAINQLAIIAGDVEAEDFVDGNKETESLLGHVYRLTNYFNRADEVLQISNAKRFGVKPRVGRIGLPENAPSHTVNVDCTARFRNLDQGGFNFISEAKLSHSWYLQDSNFYADLAETIKGAVDRTLIAGRGKTDGKTLTLRT